MSRRWWRDALSGAATLLDIAGNRSQGLRLATPLIRVTWAVTDEDLGEGWADNAVARVGPVPAMVTWTWAQWSAQQQVRAEWEGREVTRPVRIMVAAGDRHADGNVMLARAEVHQAWEQVIGSSASAS